MKRCLLPWSHMFYHSDGKVYPCCKLVDNEKFTLGESRDSVEKLWNSQVLRNLRLSFLNDTPTKECIKNCFLSPQPLHTFIDNDILANKDMYFNSTGKDGHFHENFIVWSINESNLCNFKCIYCSFKYSTKFYDDLEVKPNTVLLKSFNSLDQQLSLFKKYSSKIKTIYFAAGESMLQKGYLEMLKNLYEIGNHNVNIHFITNLSVLNYEILNYLNKFNNATLIASLDTYGERAEYIRRGTNWNVIETNRKKLFNYPNIKFMVQSVITNMNVFSLPDFHYDWIEKGFLKKDNLRYYILTSPEHFFVNVLPAGLKHAAKEKLSKYIEFLSDVEDTETNKMLPKSKIFKILKLLDSRQKTPIEIFLNKIKQKDNHENLNFLKAFPEFQL